MKKSLLALLIAGASLASTQSFGESSNLPGIVNFQACVSKAKVAQEKQKELEGLEKQFRVRIDEIQKHCKEIDEKLGNEAYIDSISAEAEEALKKERQAEVQKLMSAQNEFQQIMQQQQMAFQQSFVLSLSDAAKQVAKERGHTYVISKDACLYFDDKLDMTEDVVAKVNAVYDAQKQELEKAKVKSTEEQAVSEKPEQSK
jgi:outer membrane protein